MILNPHYCWIKIDKITLLCPSNLHISQKMIGFLCLTIGCGGSEKRQWCVVNGVAWNRKDGRVSGQYCGTRHSSVSPLSPLKLGSSVPRNPRWKLIYSHFSRIMRSHHWKKAPMSLCMKMKLQLGPAQGLGSRILLPFFLVINSTKFFQSILDFTTQYLNFTIYGK